jgi:hypothetical protein
LPLAQDSAAFFINSTSGPSVVTEVVEVLVAAFFSAGAEQANKVVARIATKIVFFIGLF